MNKLTMGSLFDGIGGFVYAGNQVDIKTLWSSEIDPACEAVSKYHFPEVEQLGDITKIDGAIIPPVDIIAGGSPCQSLSIAGKREGMKLQCVKCNYEIIANMNTRVCPTCGADLEFTRSGLFMEQIRVIREMRKATNNQYPRYMVWENVPGALSSNKGDDFRAVLEEAARCAENGVSIPQPKKWSTVGNIVGNGWSIAWRILDAQHWGVPQRRRRIFLVADFGSERAGEILFKPEGVRGNSSKSGETGKRTTADVEGGVGGRVCGFDGYNGMLTGDKSATIGINCGTSTGRNGIVGRSVGGSSSDRINTLCFDGTQITSPQNGNNPRWNDPCHPLAAQGYPPTVIVSDENEGMYGGVKCLNPHDTQSQRIYDANGIYPCLSSNETGGQNRQAICLQANAEITHNLSTTLLGESHEQPICVHPRVCGTIAASGAGTNRPAGQGNETDLCIVTKARKHRKYIIRRLTPLECERLQGFPDGWTDITYKNKPMSDSARYRMCGNSVAIPCVVRVLGGIADIHKQNV